MGGWWGVVFKGLILNGGSRRVSFKAVALNLEGGFKDVALNGGLVGGCFQGSSLEWRGAEGLVSRL